MKNTHLEHPEDTILTGDLSVLDWFVNPGNLSLKIDGAPAIVWGMNPATNCFFVGTKSVFNKVKIKIAHSHEEIDQFYEGEVASILHACFDNLPRHNWIIQGDFIGFGGNDTYRANTITYKFPEVVSQNIIIAPHTIYQAKNDLRDAIASPLEFNFADTSFPNSYVKWVQPHAYLLLDPWSKVEGIVHFDDVEEVCKFARQIAQTVTFVDEQEAKQLKVELNACIRENREIEDVGFDCDANLIRFWKLVKSIKEDCLFLCRNDGPEAYIGYDQIDAEGYVFSNKFGTFKLINREAFSYANFNSGRFQYAS